MVGIKPTICEMHSMNTIHCERNALWGPGRRKCIRFMREFCTESEWPEWCGKIRLNNFFFFWIIFKPREKRREWNRKMVTFFCAYAFNRQCEILCHEKCRDGQQWSREKKPSEWVHFIYFNCWKLMHLTATQYRSIRQHPYKYQLRQYTGSMTKTIYFSV